MRITLRSAALCFVLVAAAAAPASAQTTPPQPRPDVPVEAEAPPPPQEPTRETTRYTFRRPVVRVGQDYTLRAGEEVRNVTTILGNARIEGRVLDDVVVIMGTADIAGSAVISGALVVVGGGVTIGEGAVVRRDLVVVGGGVTAPPDFYPGGEHVVVGVPWLGDRLRDVLPWITRGLLWGRLIVPDLAWIWLMVGVLFLVYLAINTVFDRPVAASADVLVERPMSAFLSGLLVLLLTLPVLAILAASVIGLVLVPFLLCALLIAAMVGKTAVARAIGRSVVRPELPEGRMIALGAFIIGSIVLTFVYMVPVLGFVTWAITSLFGLGAATSTFRSSLRRERQVAAPEPSTVAVRPAVAPTTPPFESGEPAAAAAPAAEPMPPPPPPPLPPPPSFTQGLAAYPRAQFLDRIAAFVLDLVLVAIANALLDLSRQEGAFFLLLLAYHIAFWAWRGTTLGGIILNLRVVRTDGAEVKPADAIVRGLSGIFSIAALGIGVLWMLQDPERQMWHDKIAGTLVVKVPRELVMP